MVRYISLMIIVCVTHSLTHAQTLSAGMRLGSGVGSSLQTSGPRDYYIATSNRFQIKTSGKGYTELNSFMPPEIFVRYQSKNQFFFQAGTSFVASRILTYYGLDSEVEDRYNPDRLPVEGTLGPLPKDHLGTRTFVYMPYVSVSYTLVNTKALKPFASLGISPILVTGHDRLAGNDDENIIMNDFGRRSLVYWTARSSIGVKLYAFHLELESRINVTPIEEEKDGYTKRLTTFHLFLGYNFLNFALTKKTRS